MVRFRQGKANSNLSIQSPVPDSVIGASLSEPHTSEVNGGFFIYIQCIPYSWLFWRALKLANWSKNVIGEFQFGEYVCTACDPIAHYYARVAPACLAELILAM